MIPHPDKSKLLVSLTRDGREQRIESVRMWRRRRERILADMQLVMGALPDESKRAPLDVALLEEAELTRVIRKKTSYAAEKGDRVPAYLFVPKGLKGKVPAMLCLHQTTGIGKGEPAGLGGSPDLHYALELAERGYVTLAPDYPNFGDYRLDVYARGYASATMKGIWNHMRAVDLLQSLPEVDPARIGCIGHSLGGHNTLFLAAFDERVKVAVTSCGFNSFLKYYGGNLGGWSHAGYMPRIASVYGKDARKMPFDFTEVLAAIAPRPVFINAPTKDDNFELSGVHDCIRAAAPVYELLGAEEGIAAMHPDCGHGFPPEARRAAYAFIDKALAR
ncbi:MAG: alpha/beta fold hydrolase [Planctomycetes bacterium]|nr:alpha/beta fold hydrolase [Planctomycetota bacterium]